MAWTWSRVDSYLSWLEHGWLLIQIAGSIGLGKLIEALLKMKTTIPPLYITAIWWLATASILALLLWIGRIVRNRKPPVMQTVTTTTDRGGVNLQEVEKLYEANKGPVLTECEDSLRVQAEQFRAGNERDTFLIRNLSLVIVIAFFEATWYSIFGSQIRALERLNKGVAKIEDLHLYYNQDLDQRPQYPFEAWFGYLKNQILIRQDGFNLNITVRGKEFLKYMVQYGRTASDKKF
jgi:hypothetical protein